MNGEATKGKLFVKEEFVEWAAEAFAAAMKRATETIEWLERREIKLDTARDADPISMIPPQGFETGNYIKVKSLDGEASLRLDTLGDEDFDLQTHTEFKQLFHGIYITNTAQSGKNLVLILGRGDFEFPEAPEKINRTLRIAFTTTVLGAGGVYTSNWGQVLNRGRITGLVFPNQNSAVDGFEIQQSIDGVNADYSTVVNSPGQTRVIANTGAGFSIRRIAHYARIVYTNGAVANTVFRLGAYADSMP